MAKIYWDEGNEIGKNLHELSYSMTGTDIMAAVQVKIDPKTYAIQIKGVYYYSDDGEELDVSETPYNEAALLRQFNKDIETYIENGVAE